jgi:hypothetical protein
MTFSRRRVRAASAERALVVGAYLRELRDEVGVEQFERVMKTHLIPIDDNSGLWNDNYERFLVKRAEMIFGEVLRRCGISDGVADEYRDPIIDAIEEAFRSKIHETLQSKTGLDYWHKRIPKNIATKTDGRIEQHVNKTPGSAKKQFDEPEIRLSFCDIFDYQKIIMENWSDFSGDFRSSSDLERSIDDFNTFRNAVKHNRTLDSLLEYRAKAAIIWLSRALELDLSRYDVIT